MARIQAGGTSASWDSLYLQGGGALGAYEWGVWETLESQGLDFSLVAGVSIGAVNSAIIASRGKEAGTYLGRFWESAADPLADSPYLLSPFREQASVAKSLFFGNPSMFVPHWFTGVPYLTPHAGLVSLYDPTPLRRLLGKMVDFKALREAQRALIVSAVDVQSGELVHFDSRTQPLTLDHLMASGALPPAFPPVQIGGRWYWDGGLVNNSPIRHILESLPPSEMKRLLMVELFPREHRLPKNLKDVYDVMKDLSYMNRANVVQERHEQAQEIRALLERIRREEASAHQRIQDWPEFEGIARKYAHSVQLYSISHTADAEDGGLRDADFSPMSLRKRREQGRKATLAAIERWKGLPKWSQFAARSGSPPPKIPA